MFKYPAVFLSIFLLLLFFFPHKMAFSDELEEITKEINKLQEALNQSIAATKPLESQVANMKQQISNIKNRVYVIEQDVTRKENEIKKAYKNLEQNQKLLNRKIKEWYIKSYYNTSLLIFFSANSATELISSLAYQRAAAQQDKQIITNLALMITDLEDKKQRLEEEKQRLIVVKSNLDKQTEQLNSIISGAKTYQQEVSNKIAQLSAKQQEIINARSGSFTFTLASGELADEYLSSVKGFRESAPSGYFAIFSFGGYTHRKGMSQYGAKGRAQIGQDYKTILKAYYGKEPITADTTGTIKVSGFGEMDFEGKYLMGIAEMPSTWSKEALKAQAVAARTYAYRYKKEGKEICTSEACQVFLSSKADNPPEGWKQAVEETRGQILEDVITYYASTHGGFTTTIGWDTTDGAGGSNFIDKAYDKLGGSPWLYKAWWRKGYSNNGDTCGRANPWLSQEEMADIINAALVPLDDRITPVTVSCWGGNPYSMQELREKGGVTTVSSVTVIQGNGVTNEVIFQTNKGEIRLSGKQFRNAVFLRAPGYIRIPQGDYPDGWTFFNIEKK